MRHHLLAPLLAALAACAAPPQPTPVADASGAGGTRVICHQESLTGSSMIHTICTKEQSEIERNALREDLRHMPPNNSIAHPAAGTP